jgi:endonuclease/exonuclease/phosphatase family metal-dependent hydrolase
LQGWGWQDDGWGINVLGPTISFQTTGTQTLRIQTREDGISIDQIVLSSYGFLFSSPGSLKNDNTILQSTIQTPPANQAPQVNILANPTSGTSPLFVNFASTASDPDGYIASYSWNFGDGHTSSAVNPTNTYQSAGSYTARLTVTDNSGASSSATIPITVSAPQSTTTLRVMSWNIQFGKGTDNLTNWDRTATWITNINPDIVGLAEMPPDSISTLVALLNQKTGRTWSSHWAAKYPGCPEGNLILTKYSIVSTNLLYMSGLRSVAQATINVSGRTINFFATHLDPDSSTTRYNQVGELMNFASNFSESRIVAGDFNAGPDTSESIRMTSGYSDNWMRAMNAGTAVAYPDNPVATQTRTRRGRIDYVFSSVNSPTLTLQGTQIPDTRNLSQTNVVILLGTTDDKGVRPSDHNPMIANFQLR